MRTSQCMRFCLWRQGAPKPNPTHGKTVVGFLSTDRFDSTNNGEIWLTHRLLVASATWKLKLFWKYQHCNFLSRARAVNCIAVAQLLCNWKILYLFILRFVKRGETYFQTDSKSRAIRTCSVCLQPAVWYFFMYAILDTTYLLETTVHTPFPNPIPTWE